MDNISSGQMIRIRISAREELQTSMQLSPRDAFWKALRSKDESYSERTIASLESQLCQQFGDQLRYAMVEGIKRSLRDVEQAAYGSELAQVVDEIRHSMHYWHRHKEPEWPYYSLEPFGRLIEFRQQFLRDFPEVRASLEQLLALSQINFSTRIQSYGSLEIGITPSSIRKLAEAFSNEFETFVVLLDAFVPKAFGGVFTNQFAEVMTYQITVPTPFREAFTVVGDSAKDELPPTHPQIVPDSSPPSSDSKLSDAARKAEWVWRLANGSLLVPVILALVVLYFGMKELSAFRNTQYEALKPILEHHMLLLKEDRERMFPKEVTSKTATPPKKAESKTGTK